MPIFTIWAKANIHPDFEKICDLDQAVTAGTDNTRDFIAATIAAHWLEANGSGIIEFRSNTGAVLIRLTRP